MFHLNKVIDYEENQQESEHILEKEITLLRKKIYLETKLS